jgi:hypothetical protein
MSEQRIALVIGNSEYPAVDKDGLPNAVGDARFIAKRFRQRGFVTTVLLNATASEMSSAFKRLAGKVNQEDALIAFYFAGHGTEQHGVTYLWPKDIPSSAPATLVQFAVPVQELLTELSNRSCKKVLVLDCCRTSEKNWSSSNRTIFEELIQAAGHRSSLNLGETLIAYSTSAGESAYDGTGKHSTFCKEFAQRLLAHRCSVEDVFKDVGGEVVRQSKQGQRPWFYSSLSSDVTFSDLPHVELQNVVETPLREGVRGMVKDPYYEAALIFGDSAKAHRVTPTAISGSYHFQCRVHLLTSWAGGLAIYDADGQIVFEKQGSYSGTKINIESPHALAVSPNGKRVVFCSMSSFAVADFRSKQSAEVTTQGTSWYGALFLSKDEALLFGSHGSARKVSWRRGNLLMSDVDLETTDMLYAACRVDENSIAISGSGGTLLLYDLSAQRVKWKLSLGQTSRTACARIGGLINTITDEILLRQFLFEPWKIDPESRELLASQMSSNNLMFVTKAPEEPILITVSDEGLLYVIDARSGAVAEVIDTAAGRASNVQGLCFIGPKEFGVFSSIGTITFYSLTPLAYQQALRFIDNTT